MPADMTIERVDIQQTMKTLRNINPEYRRAFDRQMKAVLAPMVQEAKTLYPTLPLSGMARAWTPNSFSIFPWSSVKVGKSLKVRLSTSAKKAAAFVEMKEPAGVVFEAISPGKVLGANIRAASPRVLWPTADRNLPQITAGIGEIVRDAERKVQGQI